MFVSIRTGMGRGLRMDDHSYTPQLPNEYDRCLRDGLAQDGDDDADYLHRMTLGSKMYRDRKFTDIEVVCGKEAVQAHRSVLAASSPVFSKMLESAMRESTSKSIVIEDAASPPCVEHLIRFIYTGELTQISCGIECACLVRLGHRYDIAGLVQAASSKQVELVYAGNVSEVVKILRPYADDALVQPLWLAILSKIQSRSRLVQALAAGV
eukprot:TRINITY_DN28744_c0_g1_i1.p1 TRINITY_DN28744_c0_g1~~TRINITY_DN28744_c0_g1_i1.p1  ORF type:complete len:210 (+),score=20.48 TRINITY_DN28744_c0_g1_i1:369-998(+)